MAARFAIFRIRPSSPCAMESFPARGSLRYFSNSSGRVLSEEERAAENVYIQKMERERMEKARRRAEQVKATAAAKATASEKKAEGGA